MHTIIQESPRRFGKSIYNKCLVFFMGYTIVEKIEARHPKTQKRMLALKVSNSIYPSGIFFYYNSPVIRSNDCKHMLQRENWVEVKDGGVLVKL